MSHQEHAGAGSLSGPSRARADEAPRPPRHAAGNDAAHAAAAATDEAMRRTVHAAIVQGGGWLPFERFMAIALYEPGLGYYARGAPLFGTTAAGGSDFVTAPELSPLFGRALTRQVVQALDAAGAEEVLEFGAGSGALAEQVLQAAGDRVGRYAILDLPGALRERQRERLAPFGARVRWLDAWPERCAGVMLGNEVLDAMPVALLRWDGAAWLERGVALRDGRLVWDDRPTDRRPPGEGPAGDRFAPGAVVEIHPQAEAFVRTLAATLERGVALFVDYGFPEAEYYHPQRHAGTLMCHRAHRAEAGADAPLEDVGAKDITAHVNFTGIALAAQAAGLEVIGYTSQARFLLNCGLLEQLPEGDWPAHAAAQRLLGEHEMGELFKVIALARGVDFAPLGFARGDRTHTL